MTICHTKYCVSKQKFDNKDSRNNGKNAHKNSTSLSELREEWSLLRAMESPEAAIRVIAFTLQEAAKQNLLITGPNLQLTRFHTLSPPKISILKYLQYLEEKSKCDTSCFIVAMILLDRLMMNNSHVQITPLTVHKLCLCALMTAAKFNTDRALSNTFWAGIGGVRVEELNLLELEFLFLMGFSLVITQEEYKKWDDELRRKAEMPTFASPQI